MGDTTFLHGSVDAILQTQMQNEKMTLSFRRLGRRGVSQRDNDPKHAVEETTDALGNDRPTKESSYLRSNFSEVFMSLSASSLCHKRG